MKNWIFLLLIAALWVIQMTIVRGMMFFSGAADLVLLLLLAWILLAESEISNGLGVLLAIFLMELTSAMPTGAYLLFYLSAAGLAWAARRRIWQSGLLAMLFVTTLATLLGYLSFFLILWILQGFTGSLQVALLYIILPSLFLNLLWAFPIFFLIRDLASWAHGKESI